MKNDFALLCMKTLNNEFAAFQHGAQPARTNNFDENGHRLFFHEDCGSISSQEMIEWFNITMHDEDNIADNCINEEMTRVLELGKKYGWITEKTQKYW